MKFKSDSVVSQRLQKLIGNISQDFGISKLSKSPARFSTEKLNWFNREYIKMISLKEFCYRASKLKSESKPKELNYRVGDYLYIVDIENQKVLINKSTSPSGQDGNFYCIGGGRDEGESAIEGLIREVHEESGGKIELNTSKLKFIQTVNIESAKNWTRDETKFDGKQMDCWFYPASQNEIKPFHLEDDVTFNGTTSRENWYFDWFDIQEVILSNDYLNFTIWQSFCADHDLECFELNTQVRQQYLAWNLDKNRATLLSEFGQESSCIIKYLPADKELLKWKKISLEDSLGNLKEMKPILKDIYQKLNTQIQNLYSADINQIPELSTEVAKLWETELKTWLQANNKDTGSYFWPLRVALSGKAKSPSPFEILSILNPDQAFERINLYLN